MLCTKAMLKNTLWKFSHERLTVGAAFSSDDQPASGETTVEIQLPKEQVCATLYPGVEELQKGISETTGGSRAGSSALVLSTV